MTCRSSCHGYPLDPGTPPEKRVAQPVSFVAATRAPLRQRSDGADPHQRVPMPRKSSPTDEVTSATGWVGLRVCVAPPLSDEAVHRLVEHGRLLARAVRRHGERHAPIRQGRSPRLGPTAPQAAAALRVDRPQQRAPCHRGHAGPAQRRSPARRPRRPTGLAVVLGHRRHPGRRRLRLVVLPAQIRPGAHLSPAQAVPRLDAAAASRPAGGGPVDLAGDRRTHPAPSCRTAHGRPTQTLGEDHPCRRDADTDSRPARVPAHPPAPRPPGPCTKTQPSRPRTPARLQKPAPRAPLRRRQDRQTQQAQSAGWAAVAMSSRACRQRAGRLSAPGSASSMRKHALASFP